MIQIGICGCGGFIERAVLPMMKKAGNVQAVAAFDVNRERCEKVCRLFEIKHPCLTFEDLLKSDTDVIYIASPNALHKEQTIAAAQAGKHVFCQKPLGINADQCRDMIEACRKGNVKLGVGFCYRFSGALQKIMNLMREGVLGEISYIHASFNLIGYTPQNVGWRCDPKISGGGPLMDLAPHVIDLGHFLLEDKVKSVMAYVKPERTDKQIEEDVTAVLKFSRGALMTLNTSFNVRCNMPDYLVAGSKGQAHAVGTMPWLTNGQMPGTLTVQIDGRDQSMTFDTHEHLDREIRLFADAIADGMDVPVPGEAGLHAQAVVDAIYESGRTGKRCVIE